MNNEIIKAVTTILEIPDKSIYLKNRQSTYVMARMIAIKELRMKQWALQKIGRLFNLHHASVIHCLNKYQDDYDYNLLFRFIANQVQNYLANKDYLTISDLTRKIFDTLNSNEYYKKQHSLVRNMIAYTVFSRCGYSNSNFPKNFLKINLLTMLDEKYISEIYNQIMEFVDAKNISKRVG